MKDVNKVGKGLSVIKVKIMEITNLHVLICFKTVFYVWSIDRLVYFMKKIMNQCEQTIKMRPNKPLRSFACTF